MMEMRHDSYGLVHRYKTLIALLSTPLATSFKYMSYSC